MKDLITIKNKHLLWKDELGSCFLLLKCGEIFKYSENTLRVHFFHRFAFNNLRDICSTFNEWSTDDGLYMADVNIVDLPQVIEAFAPKKRFARNSKWLSDKEKKLGHKIIQYKPTLKGD